VIVAGLTGGIATGKSTVSAFLEQAGAVIVDADKIARHLVRKGQPAWQKIVDAFGLSILLPDGELDRSRLGEIIFNDPHQKRILNRIVHPEVGSETAVQLAEIEKNQPDSLVILDVPLLIESGMNAGLSEIIVVVIPEPLQIERLMHRDNLSQEQALARMRSQMPIDEKRKHATRLIDNSGSRENTRRQTMDIYRQLAGRIIRQEKS
jgi:dephospho-CoA kinase